MLKNAWVCSILSLRTLGPLLSLPVFGLPMLGLPLWAAPCSSPAGATGLEIKVDYPLFEPEERKLLVTVQGPAAREAVVEAEQTLAMIGIPAGHYTISMLRPGFLLAAGGFETARDVAAGTCEQVTLALKGAQTISGTLFDALAKPVAGVQLRLARTHDAIYTQTDTRGHFAFHEVTPGPYWISTGSDGFAEQFYPVVADQDEASIIYVMPGEDVENVKFYVPQVTKPRIVSVRVVRDDGTPAAQAKVALQPARGEDRRGVESTADDQGRVEFQAFADAPYVLVASDGQGRTSRLEGSLEIPAGAAAVNSTVQLHPAAPQTAGR